MSAPYLVAYACVHCQRSFKRHLDQDAEFERTCPHCRGAAVEVGRHFKPPRRISTKQWEKVRFLIANGFPFHRVYETKRGGAVVPYPRTIKAAQAFVKKYRDQAWRRPARPQNNELQRARPAQAKEPRR